MTARKRAPYRITNLFLALGLSTLTQSTDVTAQSINQRTIVNGPDATLLSNAPSIFGNLEEHGTQDILIKDIDTKLNSFLRDMYFSEMDQHEASSGTESISGFYSEYRVSMGKFHSGFESNNAIPTRNLNTARQRLCLYQNISGFLKRFTDNLEEHLRDNYDANANLDMFLREIRSSIQEIDGLNNDHFKQLGIAQACEIRVV
jgi:hypothetical protein